MLFLFLSYLSLADATGVNIPPIYGCYGYQTSEITPWEAGTCLDSTHISQLGYYPHDGKGAHLQYEFMTWPSQWMATYIHAILAKEVMGYTVGLTCVDGGDNGNTRIHLGHSDLAMEFWYENYEGQAVVYMQDTLTVVDAGYLGYTGRSGIYTPNYMQGQIAALSISNADFVSNVFNFWKVYTSPDVINLYTNQNDTTMVAGVTIAGNFTPPWCNQWNVAGVNQNCLDLKAESMSYDTGHVQQFIVNHRLNWTISWWGYGGVQTYVNRMMTAQRPVLFKYWVPTMFLANRPVSRLTLPESSQACLRNNTKSLDGIGSVDCDFSSTSLRKIAATRIFNVQKKTPYRGFADMTRRMQITTEQMDNLLSAQRLGNYSNSYEAACGFLKDNVQTWKSWIIERTCEDGELQGDGTCYKKPEEDHSLYFYLVLALLPILAAVFYFILKGDKGDHIAEMLMSMLSESTMIALAILLHTLDFSTDLSSFIVIAGHPDLQEFVIPYALFLSIGGCSSFTNIFFGVRALSQILCRKNRGGPSEKKEGIAMESQGNLGPSDSKRNFGEKAVITDGGKMLNIKSPEALDYYKTRADSQIRMCLVTILVCVFEDIPLLVINAMVLRKLGQVDVVVLVSLLFNTLICGTVAATWKDLMAAINAQKTLKEHLGNLSGRNDGVKGLKSSKLLSDGVVQVKSSPPMSPNSTKVVPLRSENAF